MDSLQGTFDKYFGGEHGLDDPIVWMSEEEYAKLRSTLHEEAEERREIARRYLDHELSCYPEEGGA